LLIILITHLFQIVKKVVTQLAWRNPTGKSPRGAGEQSLRGGAFWAGGYGKINDGGCEVRGKIKRGGE